MMGYHYCIIISTVIIFCSHDFIQLLFTLQCVLCILVWSLVAIQDVQYGEGDKHAYMLVLICGKYGNFLSLALFLSK